jgi:hypothetical protein
MRALSSSLVLAIDHVDQVGYQLGGLALGWNTRLCGRHRGGRRNRICVRLDFAAPLDWVHHRWKTQRDVLLAQAHQEVCQRTGLGFV